MRKGDLRMRFEDLGIPVRDAGMFNWTVGPDREGRLNTVYMTMTQFAAPYFVLAVNVETGETRQYAASADHGAWGLVVGPDGHIYSGTFGKGRLFRLNPRTGEMANLGTAIEGESYIWSLAVGADGRIYGGTYPGAKLMAYDPRTGQFEDLDSMDPTEKYNRYLQVGPDGRIYCAVGTVAPKVVAYDPRTRTKAVIRLPGLDIAGIPVIYKGEDGALCAAVDADRYGGEVYAYRIEGDTAMRIPDRVPQAPRVMGDGSVVEKAADRLITLRDRNGETRELRFDYEGAGSEIFVVRPGPDGKVWGSSVLPLRLFSYDPQTGALINHGNPTKTGGEIYSLLAHGGKLYTCAYTRACLTVYDPTKPWATGDGPDANPRHVGFLGSGQDRPVAMISGSDGAVYIGTVPTYGEFAGALTRFDPATEEWVVYRHIVPNQSVVSLASDPASGMIAAGTSVAGGGGTDPVEREARLFLWDPQERAKIYETVPVPGERQIAALAAVGGKIFGLTGTGTLFVFDAVGRCLLESRPLGLGSPHYEAFEPGPEGKLYALIGGAVIRIDPATHAVEELGRYPGLKTGFAILGDSVYLGATANLVRAVL